MASLMVTNITSNSFCISLIELQSVNYVRGINYEVYKYSDDTLLGSKYVEIAEYKTEGGEYTFSGLELNNQYCYVICKIYRTTDSSLINTIKSDIIKNTFGVICYFDDPSIHMTSVTFYDGLTDPTYNFTYNEGNKKTWTGLNPLWSVEFTAQAYTNTHNTTYEFIHWEYRIGSESATPQYSTDNPFLYNGDEDIYIRAIGKASIEGGGSDGSPYYIDCYFDNKYINKTIIKNNTTQESWSGDYNDTAFTESAGNGINISDGSSVTFEAVPTSEGNFVCWAYRIGGDSGELTYSYDNPFVYLGGEKIIIRAVGEASTQTGNELIPYLKRVRRTDSGFWFYFERNVYIASCKFEFIDENGIVTVYETQAMHTTDAGNLVTVATTDELKAGVTYKVWVTATSDSPYYTECRKLLGDFTTNPPALAHSCSSRGYLVYGKWALESEYNSSNGWHYIEVYCGNVYFETFLQQKSGYYEFEVPTLNVYYEIGFNSVLELYTPDSDGESILYSSNRMVNSIKPTSAISKWVWRPSVEEALLNKGKTTILTYTEWNSFVNFVGEKTGENVSAALMTEMDKIMTAERFNVIRQAIGSHCSFREGVNAIREYILSREGTLDGDWNIYKREIVKGQYFIDLANYINGYLINSE